MDPITSGLTILQVIQTIAQASALLYGYVASVHNAESTSRSLIDEFSAISGVLATVMGIDDDPSLPATLRGAPSLLMAKDGPVAKLQVELKNLLPNEQDSRKIGTRARFTWPFKETKAAAVVDRLKQYYRDITAILAVDSWITLKEVNRGLQELKGDSAAQKMRDKDEDRRKLLEWMSPVHCTHKHDASRRQRNVATGRWIFETDQYKVLNTSESAFLWLNGQPGGGKTIIASAVIDEIQGGGQAEPQTLAYFYCDFRDEQTTIAAAVLRSLTVQLLRQSKDDWITKIREPEQQELNTKGDPVSLRKLGQQQSSGQQCPTDLDFLRNLLVDVSKLVPRPVLVIDALDECKDHRDLLGHLVNLPEDARLRLFVTGRNEPDIKDAFGHLPTVSLKDQAEQMQEDIRVHITEQLKTQKRLSCLPETLKKTILEKMLEKAEGMFRWVQCQLDVIMDCKRSASIRNALDNLPKGLYETYDRIMRSIEERGNDDGPIAQSCLLWLAGALTPLTLDQLNEAMMIEVGEFCLNPDLRANDPMDIVVACGSLVTYDEITGVVALSHYSVKEYLISRRPINILKSISDMHARICQLLITYLLCDSVDEIPAHVNDFTKDRPLLIYAVQGLTHLEYISDEDPCVMSALSRLHSELLGNTQKCRVFEDSTVRSTGSCRGFMWWSATSPSLLLIPLELGQPWMVEFLVKQQPHLLDVDIATDLGSPLIFAIRSRPDFLDILLKLGVDLNKPSSFSPSAYHESFIPSRSHAPISWAAAIGREIALDFLLSQMKVDLPDDILHMAIIPYMPSPKAVRKFLQRGADINFTVNGSTPVHSSLSKLMDLDFNPQYDERHLPAVKELVEPPCNLSVQNWTARTALHIALDEHLPAIVTYLLDQNAPLSATSTLHPNMWSWARNETWFAKIQATALAADRPSTRIQGKVIDVTTESHLVEFPGAVTADHEDPNPICAVVVSAIGNGSELSK
ncbi:hypothetical protein DFH29DRAFT_1002195 [Suillus ampliporus]|nr:hypothetical protein DFH29DRAFT_1002195 [Suillus ampliporus]